ncbi:MAG TPA: hypothetical protein DIU01_02055 [Flavobacterium sp.]|nr:hypothetical protein [Flavobacterium sp.]
MSISTIYGQEESIKKIQLGISYSLTNQNEVYKNPFNGYVNYQLKKWDQLDLNGGLRVFYFGSKESANFSNKWGVNPNIGISHYFKDDKFNTYLNLGYYFDTFEFKPTTTGSFTTPKRELKTNGFTIAPGLKYIVQSNVYVDANLTLLIAKEKDNIGSWNSSNNTLFNIGIGVAF